jgi:drug/metabolite transporter (DMT)-like permease
MIAGGLLFGAAYLVMARSIRSRSDGSITGDYLSLCAYGIVIFVISLGSSEIYTPYPPFGVVSFSFVSLGSYLFGFGIYSTARAVSEDISLVKKYRNLVVYLSRVTGLFNG